AYLPKIKKDQRPIKSVTSFPLYRPKRPNRTNERIDYVRCPVTYGVHKTHYGPIRLSSPIILNKKGDLTQDTLHFMSQSRHITL
ncbi:hypothetical protein RDWZM_008522, partial [Blomia tropicalis]